jgi:outer membrane protein OmpA-like peptidoglycan-associated protein
LGVADLVVIAAYLAPAAYPGLRAGGAVGGPGAVGPSARPKPAPSDVSTPAPVTPAPVTPAPVKPAPVKPAPVKPAPVTPAPVTPAPVKPAPVKPAPVKPAPVKPARATSTGAAARFTAVADVFFALNSRAIDGRKSRQLRKLAARLRKLPAGTRVEIHGYADIQGAALHNRRLSRLRTIAVHYYLRRLRALTKLEVRLRYFGSRRASSSDDPKRRARDRRVRVLVERSGK